MSPPSPAQPSTKHLMPTPRDGSVVAQDGMEEIWVGPHNNSFTGRFDNRGLFPQQRQATCARVEAWSSAHITAQPSSVQPVFKFGENNLFQGMKGSGYDYETKRLQKQVLTDVFRPTLHKDRRSSKVAGDSGKIAKAVTTSGSNQFRASPRPRSQPNSCKEELVQSSHFPERSLAMRVLRPSSCFSETTSGYMASEEDFEEKSLVDVGMGSGRQCGVDFHDYKSIKSEQRERGQLKQFAAHRTNRESGRRPGLSENQENGTRSSVDRTIKTVRVSEYLQNSSSKEEKQHLQANSIRHTGLTNAWVSSSAHKAIPEIPKRNIPKNIACHRSTETLDDDDSERDSAYSSFHHHPSDAIYNITTTSDQIPNGKIPNIGIINHEHWSEHATHQHAVPTNGNGTPVNTEDHSSEYSIRMQQRDHEASEQACAEHNEPYDERSVDGPVYLDSYHQVQRSGRASLWGKLRNTQSFSPRHRDLKPNISTSTKSSYHSHGYIQGLWRRLSNASGDKRRREERCPNCNEVLQKAPPMFLAMKGNEKTFLMWILSKWGERKEVKNFGAANQSGYLPHYCNFVRSKTLHDRNNSPALVTDDDDDEYDGGLLIEPPALGDYDDHHEDEDNREVDPAPTDTDLQRDDSKSPTTKPAPTVNITDSGQDAGQDRRRDVATSTADHDPETLIRRLKEGGLAGPASRDPIQIPSADGSLKPTDTTDSARSKTENNLDALFDTLTSKNVKAKKLPPGLVDQPPPKVKGKRACAKKEKMPVKERKRKGKKKEKSKESSEPQEQQPEVPAQNLDIPDTPAASEIPVPTAEVPDLPTMNIGSEGPSRDKRRNAKKQQLVAPTPVPVQKASGVKPVASTEPAFTYYDFGDLASTTATTEDTSITDWTSGRSDRQERTVLSLQSSRFELPMDMKSLETMSPQEYLRKYCVVSPRRQALYNKVFWKHKDRSGSLLGQRNLCEALKDVLVNTIKYGQGEDLCNLLEIEDNTTVDLKLFSGVAALAERILYPDFVTEDTADKTEYHKDKVECADFCGLKWKLHGVQVGEHVRQLLESLG